MRRTFLAIALLAAVPTAALASSNAPRLRVVAWASTSGKLAVPPKDAVASGGIYCRTRPIKRMYAFVRFSGMRNRVPSSATWFYEGDQVFVYRWRWNDGPVGRTAFDLHRTKGTLEEGTYRIEVRFGARLVGRGSVDLRFGDCRT